MLTERVLEAQADALDAAAEVLRRRAREAAAPRSGGQAGDDLASRIVHSHPGLGPRQVQVINLLSRQGEEGTETRWLFETMGYDQANLYLVLKSLVQRGIVDKLADRYPHRYRISARYRGSF